MASVTRPASQDRPAAVSPWHPKAVVSEEGLNRLERQAKACRLHRVAYPGWILDHYSDVVDRLPAWGRAQVEHCMQHPAEFLKVLMQCGLGPGLVSETPSSGCTPRREEA
jgi:hypothetical protein